MISPEPERIRWLYRVLRESCSASGALTRYWGTDAGWPAADPFEVVVGAVLVQNTAWRNAERALANLKARNGLEIRAVLAMPVEELTETLRPAGAYRIKARYLRNVSQWLDAGGGFEALEAVSTESLRNGLLAVTGIGPETADAILLYAFKRPVFVIDAYTRRILRRMGFVCADFPYETLRHAFEAALPSYPGGYAELHALLVAHAKAICRTQPLCGDCALRGECARGRVDEKSNPGTPGTE